MKLNAKDVAKQLKISLQYARKIMKSGKWNLKIKIEVDIQDKIKLMII
ncbi:hypothetical protein [Mycoplasmopsis agassizii]|nr:hypothetical protein [Mycoplasmopsis agassizii]SMC18980.1 hypothetical protein SAMN02745179_00819 [Mycoplasmopsis agassizii]